MYLKTNSLELNQVFKEKVQLIPKNFDIEK